jgi:hypothetical protein
MNVIKFFFLMLILGFSNLAKTQEAQCISINGLDSIYYLNNPIINLKIINSCDTTIKFIVKYQQLINNEWITVWDDVNCNYYDKKRRIFILHERDSILIRFNSSDYPLNYLEMSSKIKPNKYCGTYRFAFFQPRNKQTNETLLFFSLPFQISP